MECSSMAVASCFRLLPTILLLAMAGRCSSQQMDQIQLSRIADSIDELTQVVQVQAVALEKIASGITSMATAQTVASEKVAAGIMEKFTSVATAQTVASEKVSSGIMKMFTLLARDNLVCEKGWVKLRSSCYFMSHDISTWEESREKCIALNSDFVKITDDEEYNFLRELAKGYSYYIGLSDLQEEGTYRWVADDTIHQIVESWWREGEPNNRSPGEDCIQFKAPNQGLNDIFCDTKFRYICKKPGHLPWNLASVPDEETPTEK